MDESIEELKQEVLDLRRRDEAQRTLLRGFTYLWLAEKVAELEGKLGISPEHDEGGWFTSALFSALEDSVKNLEEDRHRVARERTKNPAQKIQT